MQYEDLTQANYRYTPVTEPKEIQGMIRDYVHLTHCSQFTSAKPCGYNPQVITESPLKPRVLNTSYSPMPDGNCYAFRNEANIDEADWQHRFYSTYATTQIQGEDYPTYVMTYSPNREPFFPYPTEKTSEPKIIVLCYKNDPVTKTATKFSAEFDYYDGSLSGYNYSFLYLDDRGKTHMDQIIISSQDTIIKIGAYFGIEAPQIVEGKPFWQGEPEDVIHPPFYKEKWCNNQFTFRKGENNFIYVTAKQSMHVRGAVDVHIPFKDFKVWDGMFFIPCVSVHPNSTFGRCFAYVPQAFEEENSLFFAIEKDHLCLANNKASWLMPIGLKELPAQIKGVAFNGENYVDAFWSAMQNFQAVNEAILKSCNPNKVEIQI